MGKTSTASKNKYNLKTYERIEFVVPMGFKQIVKDRAEELGLSTNAYIKNLIEKDLEILLKNT